MTREDVGQPLSSDPHMVEGRRYFRDSGSEFRRVGLLQLTDAILRRDREAVRRIASQFHASKPNRGRAIGSSSITEE